MTILHCKVCSPIRALLPVSLLFFILPWVFKRVLLNFYAFIIFYFFGSYFFFINFPFIGEVLHSKPTYVNDLTLISNNKMRDETFKRLYIVTMNLILAILLACFAEYTMVQGIINKPLVEILAIIGGNLSVYMKTQNIMGKILIYICNNCKEERKRKTSMSESKKVTMTVETDVV